MQHHYIPCFYTKRWGRQDKRIVEFSRPYKNLVAKPVRPEGTGFENDLWTIPFTDAARRDLIEQRVMGTIDQIASNALCKIESNNILSLTVDERMYWATFLISVIQRHPDSVARLHNSSAEIFDDIINNEMRSVYNDIKAPFDPETIDDWIEIKRHDGYFEQSKVISFQSAILLPETTKFICDLSWGVCTFDTRYCHELLTSDRPILMSNGLAQPLGHIAIPIGPNKLFMAAKDPSLGPKLCRSKGFAETVNDLIVRQAVKYVYATDERQRCFIDKRLKR